MAGRRKDKMENREIVRQLRAGESIQAIARNMGLHRKTIRRYKRWAEQQGLLVGELPAGLGLERLMSEEFKANVPPQQMSTVEPYDELVKDLVRQEVDGTVIWRRLQERGYTGSWSSIYRYLHRLNPPGVGEVYVRVEVEPGEEGQVDFGYVGYLLDEDGQAHKAWAFVMVLGWSRHMYVEFVFDQRVETWLKCHANAFEFFEGTPRRVVLDNLKAGILRRTQEDAHVQQAYRECAEHYGFILSPCRPRTPEHKGKVERSVQYVQRAFMAGRGPLMRRDANRLVRSWCCTEAGLRIHGTTKQKPLDRFIETEGSGLRALPAQRYDRAVWKSVKLHRDCYLVFEGAFYSAPFRLVGQTLLVRGGTQDVQIYTQDQQWVATHDRASAPGERLTHPAHLPPEKAPGVLLTPDTMQAAASDIGPSTARLVQTLLDDPLLDRRDNVRRVLALRERYGDYRLEAACERALHFGDPSLLTLQRILEKGLDQQPLPVNPSTNGAGRTFARTAVEILGSLFGTLPRQ
jgi:transposase